MSFLRIGTLALALAAGLAAQTSPVQASVVQFKLELFVGDISDPFGDDIADAVGTITVNAFDPNSPDFASDLSASITFDNVTYDYDGPEGFPLQLNQSTLRIADALLADPYPATEDNVPALFFVGGQATPFFWQQRDCRRSGQGGFACISPERGVVGGYTLTAVPAVIPPPASAALLPLGLGALALIRRRRARAG